MEVEHLELDHHPDLYRPFTLLVFADGQAKTFWLTEQQLATIFDQAQAPLMRARASRSTPGLVHP